MADKYASYRELAAANTLGIDYDIINRYGEVDNGYILHIAIHGGAIESPTSQLAEYVADGGPYYTLYGKKPIGNSDFSIGATRFDEPQALVNVARSARTIGWYGYADEFLYEKRTYIGGLDLVMGGLLMRHLNDAGFLAEEQFGALRGGVPEDIINRNRANIGTSISISRTVRQSFFKNGDLRLSSISNPMNRTEEFFKFCEAVKAAIAEAPAPVVPRIFDTPQRPPRVLGDPRLSRVIRRVFGVNQSGGIDFTTNPEEQLVDRVHALVSTLPGERVMRTTYGVATTQLLFAPDAQMADLQLQDLVTDAVTEWEPSAVISRITSTTNDALGIVNINVGVSRADVPQAELANTRTVSVKVGGGVVTTPR